jgi:hypothetical protein
MGLIKKVKNSSTLTKYIKTILSHSTTANNKISISNNSEPDNNKNNNNNNLQDMSLKKIISEMEDPIEIFKKFLFNP